MEREFSESTNLPNFHLLGALGSGEIQSSDFYCKSTKLAWIRVVWAILREHWLGTDLQGWAGKQSESHARLS